MATTNPINFFKCLSDETRLSILLLLKAEGELCVCELTEALQESQPKISRHLALLRQAELLEDRRQGVWIYYQINRQLPDWAQQIIAQALSGNTQLTRTSRERLNAMGNRPERQTQCCD